MDTNTLLNANALATSLHVWLIAAGILTLLRIGYVLWRAHRELDE